MQRDPQVDDQRIQRWRDVLAMLVRVQIEPVLAARIDLSGVVQQSLLEAVQHFPGDAQLAHETAWLRRILANNLADEIRKLGAGKREWAREQSLQAALDQSSARLDAILAADQSSPSEQAQRNEELERVTQCLGELPELQRQALILHHWHGWPLARIAEHLDTSKPAVAGLLKRGMKTLRGKLGET